MNASRPTRARLALALLLCATLLLGACGGGTPTRTARDPDLPVSIRANDVLFRALGLVGTPYRYGGNTPSGGFDCSGLIVYAYRNAAQRPLPFR